MKTMNEENKIPLTEEQTKILNEVYQYEDRSSLSSEEIGQLAEIFDKPEKLALLRKAFSFLVDWRNDLGTVNPFSLLGKNPDDLAKFGQKVAVSALADETCRSAIAQLYVAIRNHKAEVLKEKYELQAKEDFEQGKKTDAVNKENQIGSMQFGPRV